MLPFLSPFSERFGNESTLTNRKQSRYNTAERTMPINLWTNDTKNPYKPFQTPEYFYPIVIKCLQLCLHIQALNRRISNHKKYQGGTVHANFEKIWTFVRVQTSQILTSMEFTPPIPFPCYLLANREEAEASRGRSYAQPSNRGEERHKYPTES